MNQRENAELLFNASLNKLAVGLKPSDEYLKQGNLMTQKIFDVLKTRSRYSIDHTLIAGSAGKNTTIIDSDIDGILFLNNEYPLYRDILDEWDNILELTENLGVQNIHKTKYSIQFQAKSYDFDLLPAPNFVNQANLTGEQRIKLQQKRTLEKIAEDPVKYSYLYSAALSESIIQFVRKQEGFVNEIIRIVKFWYKTVHIPDYLSGAKQLIELIAIYAAHMERSSGAPTNKMYLRTFARFMDMITGFDRLNVIFYDEYEIPRFQSVARLNASVHPCVLDPSNPYNDLAKVFADKPYMKDMLISYARETKNRLHRLLDGHWHINMDSIAFIFAPQPQIIPDLPEKIKKAGKLVSYDSNLITFPDKKIRKDRLRTDGFLLHGFDMMQLYLSIQMVICEANPSITSRDLQTNVEHMVDRSIGRPERDWIPSNDRHEDYDITFTLPFGNKGNMKISFKDLYD